MHIPSLALALSLCAGSLLAGAAHATPEAIFPGLIDVVDVAADDILNIRAAPNADAPIIGTFAHDAQGIEVIASNGGWLQVNNGERTGWISGRYAVMRRDIWQEDALPDGFACYGTEPFWSVTLDGDIARFATPESVVNYGDARVMGPFNWAENPRRVIAADGLSAFVTPAHDLCFDGMSDAGFALDADVVVGHGDAARYLQGCCTISR